MSSAEDKMMKEKVLSTKLANGQIALFYLGQVGFLVKYEEKYLLIDGYLSDYVDRNCCSELVKWVRKYPAPIKAEELDFVDFLGLNYYYGIKSESTADFQEQMLDRLDAAIGNARKLY